MNSFTVLVVEDDDAIREAIVEVLELEKIEVVAVPNGKEALDHLTNAENFPGLVLLDLNMPIMSGKDFIQHFQKSEKFGHDIPIVLMTAVPDPQLPGVVGILKKPVELDSLLQTVKTFLEKNPPPLSGPSQQES